MGYTLIVRRLGPTVGLAGKRRKMTSNSKTQPLALKLVRALLLWIPLLLVVPAKAYGYADPGTGAFLYQAAYAAFLGGTFYLRRLLDRLWRRRTRVEPDGK
jgi:hypothetical protein